MKLDKELYNVDEVAELLGLQVRTIRKYIADGKLNAVKIVGNVRITREELEKQVKEIN